MIQHSSDGIFVFDPSQAKILEANTSLLDLLGYTEEEFINLKVIDIVSVSTDEIDTTFRKLVDEKSSLQTARKFIRKDRNLVDVELSITVMRVGNSEVGLVNVHNVTEQKKAENALRTSYEKIKLMLNEMVNALVNASEKRDPYTAGHQRQVAKLACLMAKEIGLSEDQIEGLHFAALLHDIGKIYVPSDILNKPGRLSEMEMGIIKTHPVVGYEIIEKIPFGSPVAEILLQHHERLNGTGYPKGLSGEDILLEARILGVADVIEAMASHRPYRPALGLQSALNEIDTNKGILYDKRVVATVIKILSSHVDSDWHELLALSGC